MRSREMSEKLASFDKIIKSTQYLCDYMNAYICIYSMNKNKIIIYRKLYHFI